VRTAGRHITAAAAGALVLALVAPARPAGAQANAKAKASAEVKVQVQVVPSLIIGGPSRRGAAASLHAEGASVIVGTVPFALRANTGAVRLQVGATSLYHGADPNAPVIPLEVGEPARFSSFAGDSDGPGGRLAWTSEPFRSHGLAGNYTAQCSLEGAGGEAIQLDADVTLRWRESANRPPAGTYAGYVRLIAEIGPP
jgi:hypothetical protein